jgi:two-component system, LuxR family, response regulator FixJ
MNTRTNILLVDGDFRRRAAISHCLSGGSLHVEPFEDASEFIARSPREGVALVHDDGAGIGALLDHMGSTGNWLPIIAFAEQPGPRAMWKPY